MKFYEALTILKQNPKGYVVETTDSSCYGSTIMFDKEGKLRETWGVSAIAGNQGRLLSFCYYNSERTDKLLRTREFIFVSTFKELCMFAFNKIVHSYRPYTPQDIGKYLKRSVKKHVCTSEEAEELLATYIKEYANV